MQRTTAKIAAAALMLCLAAQGASALSTSRYASSSKLAQGKWVKIAVPKTGVYELTAEELSQMGFSSPALVRVFGWGGNAMSEVLNSKAPDDLQQVPTQLIGGKLVFYANGPVGMTLSGPTGATPHYVRTINPYSRQGYYFLTEGTGSNLEIKQVATTTQGTVSRPSSLDYVYHEQELVSLSTTGKDLLGETLDGAFGDFSFTLPGMVLGTPIMVNPCVAGNATAVSYVTAYLNMGGSTDTAAFTVSSARVSKPRSGYVKYNSASPTVAITPTSPAEQGSLRLGLICSSGSITSANLDYYILTYTHRNALQPGTNELRMGFNLLTAADRIEVADSSLVVWNIDDTNCPVQYTLAPFAVGTDSTGAATSTGWAFSPAMKKNWAQFIAFDPKQELNHITSWQAVANQNIHADSVPDLVIITNPTFADQAQRIAQMHRLTDGMRVNVYNQEQVFNEFSSGTPDAMAIRWMNKMFYDRDTEGRFRYLLMLGCGSFDNRGITTDKPNRLITYQSDISNDENYSFVSDDFFGLLDDNSGYDVTSDLLRLGVGRIPSADAEECKADVDKLFNYIENPDYGVWRNNALVTSDQGDDGLHQFQAEGISQLIETDLGTGMVNTRVYNGMFPSASAIAESSSAANRRTAIGARNYISQQLLAGQYFATYVGHADPTTFTKVNHMWTTTDVSSTANQHLPIVTTACCDVARYDSDSRGIAELMFHKKDGGAIALLTSARAVYANSNDQLNRAFVQGMFQRDAQGRMPRLGDAYIAGKQSFGTSSDYSKMSFLLLGDPALAVNFPKNCFQVVKVNGQAVTDSDVVATMPLHKVTIEANVLNDDGTVNTTFNGTGTVTLYDRAENFGTFTGTYNRQTVSRTATYPRTQLAQVSAPVVNGVLTTSFVVPRYVNALGYNGLISVYAHQSGTTHMVNGNWPGIKLSHLVNDGQTIVDNEAPVIQSMFLNDEQSFAENATVPANSTLYITATDDVAISTQQQSLGQGMTLMLDGTTSYAQIGNLAQVADSGRTATVVFPLSGLTTGSHTLTFTVADVAGNQATRTIQFQVSPNSQLTLGTQEQGAAVQHITFTAQADELSTAPQVTLKVTNGAGQVVWTKTTSTFPYQWNLTDAQGAKLAPGLYHYWGTYQAGASYGGTPIGTFVVIEPYNKAQ